MDVRYLYDSTGAWIAFQDGDFVFGRDGMFLGWTPWSGDGSADVVTAAGEYLGTILPVESGCARLYALSGRPYPGYAGRPEEPDYPGYPGHPGLLPPVPLPAGARDIDAPLPVHIALGGHDMLAGREMPE